MKTHPLYADEALVRQETQRHLDAGLTTFQLWLTQPTERLHASWVLGQLDLPDPTRVLSLGCGVAGMEDLWRNEQPDLRFTLVNISQAQLDLSMCPGRKVCCDALEYDRPPYLWFDLIVMAYMLGHVDAPAMLRHAISLRTPGTTILVLDIFDGGPLVEGVLHYDAPRSADMLEAGFEQVEVPGWHLHAPLAGETALVQAAVAATKPAMWVYRA